MATKPTRAKSHVHYHRDGSVWAKGKVAGKKMHGYWEFFRKDGVIMRSGSFKNGVQTGEWSTYDSKGEVYKVTRMKPKSRKKGSPHAKS